MVDFTQGKITIIHDFNMDFEILRKRLKSLRGRYPMGVIIPVLECDLSNPAIHNIVEELNECDYLKKVYIALSSEDREGYENSLRAFKKLSLIHI